VSNISSQSDALRALNEILKTYTGARLNYDSIISIECIEKTINDFSNGKAAGFDLLTAEHLKYCHPIVLLSLKLLFSIIFSVNYVPNAFGSGNTVPLPKASSKGHSSKVADYRGITILLIISKLFEFTMQKCLSPFLTSSIVQFGFKKGHSCTQAVFFARKIVENFTRHASTVNVCFLDISKAFDVVNYIKLYGRSYEQVCIAR